LFNYELLSEKVSRFDELRDVICVMIYDYELESDKLYRDVICDYSYRVLESMHNSSHSPMWRWNQTSIYVFEKRLHRIVLLLLIWACQINLWGGRLLQIPLLWILILESLLWKVDFVFCVEWSILYLFIY